MKKSMENSRTEFDAELQIGFYLAFSG